MKLKNCHWNAGLLATSLVVLSNLAWAGDTSQPAQSGATLAPSLSKEGAELLALTNIAGARTALNAPFEAPIKLQLADSKAQNPSEREVNDCKTLRSLKGKISGTVDIADWGFLLRQQASCEALGALTSVRPSSVSQLPVKPWPEAWRALTNPALWPAEVLPQMGDDDANTKPTSAGRSLKQAHGSKPWRIEAGKHTPEGIFVLKDAVAIIHLQPLARGDFDGDGQQDWLVLWSAHANGGSWENVRSALLSYPTGQKMIRLTWLPRAP